MADILLRKITMSPSHTYPQANKDTQNRTVYTVVVGNESCMMLDVNADINRINGSGMTTLCLMVKYGHISAVRILLDRGADPNIPDADGTTPLLYACARNELELARILLDHGANPHVGGGIILEVAKGRGYTDIVNLLLSRSASGN